MMDNLETEFNEEQSAKDMPFILRPDNSRYFGKYFSILGDSISTLDGYNPRGYRVFYNGDNCIKSGVMDMKDTWWGKTIEYFGGKLLVNNSWSGCRVTKLPQSDSLFLKLPQSDSLFPSGCSCERTSSLHNNDVNPDVIIVYLGTNDWAYGAYTGNDTRILGVDYNEYFDYAYNDMLEKLEKNYPWSEIWCCTLCETYMRNQPDFTFPHRNSVGTHIEEYNNVIRDVVFRRDCRLIDLYSIKKPYDTIDGSHPSSDGMNTLAKMIIAAISGQSEGWSLYSRKSDMPN